jgi:hypothetical protein
MDWFKHVFFISFSHEYSHCFYPGKPYAACSLSAPNIDKRTTSRYMFITKSKHKHVTDCSGMKTNFQRQTMPGFDRTASGSVFTPQ